MEQQTGGFGPWPSDEALQLGVVGAAEPIEAAEAADVVGAAEDEGEALAESTEDPAWDSGEQAHRAWERADAWASADVGEPGDAWGSADAGEPEDDAWEVGDSVRGSEAESAGEQPQDPAPAPDPGPRPKTGEPRVDAALARLDELAGRPVTEHRQIFEDVHRRLRDVLGELDTREPPEPHNAPRPESRAGR